MKRFSLILLAFILCCVVVAQQKYHDAAIFNAPYGNVKFIDYDEGRIVFAKDGSLVKKESTYLEMFSKYIIKRNPEGYPILVITEFDKSEYEYDAQHRISKRTIIVNGSKIIYTYDYSKYPNVTITLLEYKGGKPKKSEVEYDMNGFDFRGNWIQKGKEGECIEEQRLSKSYASATSVTPYSINLETEYKYIGQEKEVRKISYWRDQTFTFKRTDSSLETNLYYGVRHPFFFGVGKEAKDIEKYIKKNKVEHIRQKELSTVEITIPNSGRVFYGYPIVNMKCRYISKKYSVNYKFTIKIDDKAEREAFAEFLMEEGIKYVTLKESGKNGLCFEDNLRRCFYLKMGYDGIDVYNTSFWY